MLPRALLADREHVLLDFGVCVRAVFGVPSARAVADRLRVLVGPELPESVACTDDPFALLRYAATIGATATYLVENELTRQECLAIRAAVPTPGIVDAVRGLAITGHTVTVVSDNSTRAVAWFLRAHRLARYVVDVCGRDSDFPELLKPSPFPLRQAMTTFNTTPDRCCLIAAAVPDLRSARAAGVPVIGYADRAAKRAELLACGADAVITDLAELDAVPHPLA